MKKNFLFISCEEAKHICDKTQYNEATLLERFKLKLRLSWCHLTKSYLEQNSLLTESIHKAGIDCLNLSEKERLQKKFNAELAKQQDHS
jgi:hypothetical protein